MHSWGLTLRLSPGNGNPLFLQIARGIAERIRSGQIRPGTPLPGSRSLARSLGINRNTVIAGYDQLFAEGWIVAEPTRGTFVSPRLPQTSVTPPPACSIADQPAYTVGARLEFDGPPLYPPGALVLARGAPDIRLLPVVALTRAYRRAVLREGRELLGLGEPQGDPRLRRALATMLAETRGLSTTAETLLVTRGSQMGLDLTARALLSPGDVVVVEGLGHPSAWNAFRLAGATLVPVPVDGDGLTVESLAAIQQRTPIRAIYVTPHHQFPTTVVMPAGRRMELLAFATRHRIVLIEDDYDHEFHYAGRPILPLASADRAGVVVYLGTLSKLLAQGFRVGFVAAPKTLIEQLTRLRIATDLQGDRVLEAALADLFETDEIGRHARRLRRIYRSRRDALAESLHRHLGTVLDFELPSGGMALWARVVSDVDLPTWVESAQSLGVYFRGAGIYDFHQAEIPFARMGFSAHTERELDEAVHRLARALRTRGRQVV
jgi:GntR family transcriptional regulator/MocR family aminotransferase